MPPLLLVPGLMCDEAVWAPVLPALRSRGPCEVFDPGAGDSLVSMAQRLLASAPAQFRLAGHSMGGRVALEVLRLAPERVTALGLLDTGYQARAAGQAGQDEMDKRMALLRTAREQGVRAMAQAWVQGMVHPARLHDAALVEAIVAMFERRSADTFAQQIQALLARPDGSDVLRSVRVPALVACGRQDSWSPPAQHEAIHALMPQSQLEVIEDAGHMAPMERPEAVAAALLRWLDRAGGTA